MNSSYEQKHPLYAASFTKRRKAMDLYEGGERIEGNRAYLTRHTYESDKQYDIRASRATYRNFAAPIVDVRRPQRLVLLPVGGRHGSAGRRFLPPWGIDPLCRVVRGQVRQRRARRPQ